MNNSVSGKMYHNPDRMEEYAEDYEKLAEIGCLAAGLIHEINNHLNFILINFTTLAEYFCKYRKISGEVRKLKALKSKASVKNLPDSLCCLEKMIEALDIDFISNDLDNLLGETEEGLRRIKEIVASVKDFTHIGNPKDFKEFYLYKCIDKALLLSRNETRHVASIKKDYSMIVHVEGNENQMIQVFLNLILNAAHAIGCKKRNKPGNIKIRTCFDNQFAYCEISDDGVGIPRENLKSVFDPFFTTRPSGCGTGLGLSISYDIVVNRHKGEMFVESTPGTGTKFTVKLPLRQKRQ